MWWILAAILMTWALISVPVAVLVGRAAHIKELRERPSRRSSIRWSSPAA
ncbi:MAG: hypothetical protein WAW17_18725 [Rhodococcus sp. (in: high G+C Gram-positive bacteria)]